MQSAGRIVDAWMQHPTAAFLRQPMFESLRRWAGGTLVEGEPPLEATIGALDGAGVRLGLMSAWWGPQGPLITNDEVAAAVRRFPDRLVGIASVNLHRPMEAVRELRRAVRQLGFRGLRLIPWLWDLPPDDRRYYPLYAECIELGIPFCLQVGHTGPLCPSEPGRPIPYLDRVALEFPDLRIVGGHIGYPWTAEMISLATKYPNVYIDTSAYKVRRYPRELVDYLRAHGKRKVLFGSNHPAWPPASCLEGFDALGLDAETEELFLFRNAERVFALEPGGHP
jgi:predicted TIM-barrel fold metal-dependent hydrolase